MSNRPAVEPVPLGRTARRLEWQFLPPHIRTLIADRCGSPIVSAASQGGGFSRDESYDRVTDSLALCGMLGVANRAAESLGLLDRKRLELARALATAPTLLLLDEIGGGLTDAEASELVDAIRELRRRGIGIVWIEHIVHVLLQIAERLICMDGGKIIADGEPKAVLANPDVMAAYLGSVAA